MRPNINKPAVCCCCFRSTLMTRNNKNKQTPVKVVGIGRLLGAVGAEFKTETVHKHQPASHSYDTNRAVSSSVRLRGVSIVVYSSPVPSLSPCVCVCFVAYRWVKFEEKVEEGGERWSKPHVSTLSLHSLFELRTCLQTGTVLLDLEGYSLPQIVGETNFHF